MTVLLENLSNNEVHRLVKPQILSVFGDVALAVGNKFSKYLEVVLQTLREASNAQVDRVSSKQRGFIDSRGALVYKPCVAFVFGSTYPKEIIEF